MFKHRLLGMALIFGATLFLPEGAQGANAKWYPGIQCQQDVGTLYHWNGTAMAVSSDITVRCPFYTDNNETFLHSAQIRVYDRHPTKAVGCTLYTEIYEGTILYQNSEHQATTSSSPNVMTLEYGKIDTEFVTNHYALCGIPAASNGAYSHVVAFYVNED